MENDFAGSPGLQELDGQQVSGGAIRLRMNGENQPAAVVELTGDGEVGNHFVAVPPGPDRARQHRPVEPKVAAAASSSATSSARRSRGGPVGQ